MATLYEVDAVGRRTGATETRRVQFVVKTSKLCNLRCRYCYEFSELGQRDAITLSQLRAMYRHIAEYYERYSDPVSIEFDWHGGEPLLLDPDFYWTTFDDQTNIFLKDTLSVTNVVQTNLLVLNERLIKLLFEGFDGVGVSIDLFGGLRVRSSGVDSQETVLKNMDQLRRSGIDFGCITVLTKQNIDHSSRIFRFFEKAGISFRLLPVFRGATDTQNEAYQLSDKDVLGSLKEFFELWVNCTRPIIVEPLFTYTEHILAAYTSDRRHYYDKSSWESIYIVNTDGNVYSYADLYNPTYCHGNIFVQPLSQLIRGRGHERAIHAAVARMNMTCASCRHHGRACSGYPVAEESPTYGHANQVGTIDCVKVRGILDYIERRLHELGVIDPVRGTINLPKSYRPRFMPALTMFS
jgi:uncharacterized protein